jgi:hypothetical protein
MTFEEVEKGLAELLKNPDTAQAGAKDFLEKIKPDYDTMESLSAKSKEDDKRIRDLQDTNQKLFLSVTGENTEEEEQKNEDNPIDWDSLMTETEERT